MATKYDPHIHTHATINPPKRLDSEYADDLFRMPEEIILHTGERVWIPACYMTLGTHPDIIQVGDGHKGFDQDGNCVVSIPASWCRYYTPEEAENIVQCIDADDRLLSYAR